MAGLLGSGFLILGALPSLAAGAGGTECFLRAGVAADLAGCQAGTSYDTWTYRPAALGGGGWTAHAGYNCWAGHGAKRATAALGPGLTNFTLESCQAAACTQCPWHGDPCTAITMPAPPVPPAPPAPPPPPDPDVLQTPRHSVSGFSGGASMAVNHLVAFADLVEGLGIIGGSPYGCCTVPDCGNSCSGYNSRGPHLENTSIPWTSWVGGIRDGYLEERARRGLVAPLAHLVDMPVFLFSGLDDVYVYQSVMRAVATQFRNLSSRVHTEFGYYAAHAWVVDSETCKLPGNRSLSKAGQHASCCGLKGPTGSCVPSLGNYHPSGCCGVCSAGDEDARNNTRLPKSPGWRPPINSCDFDLSGEILRWVRGGGGGGGGGASRASAGQEVRPRKPVVPANLLKINQSQFLPANWTAQRALLDEVAYVYVPRACQLPPTGTGGDSGGDSDDRNAGHDPDSDGGGGGSGGGGTKPRPLFASSCPLHVHYHPCGGAYRQVGLAYMLENAWPAYAEGNNMVVLYPQSGSESNPAGAGCFDWYGAVGPAFDTRLGLQLNVVLRMLRQLRGA
jgi:hypothetical protein